MMRKLATTALIIATALAVPYGAEGATGDGIGTYHDAPISFGQNHNLIGSLYLPAGRYLITAKALLLNGASNGTPLPAKCAVRTRSGVFLPLGSKYNAFSDWAGDIDYATVTLPPYGGSTEAVLTVVGNHYWSGYVNFECGVECDNGPSNCYLTFSQFPQAKAIKILATQVGTLTNITE